MKYSLCTLALKLVAAAGLLSAGSAAAHDLSVCIDATSPTAAMDRGVAEAVARQAQLSLQVHDFDGRGDDDGFAPKQFNRLAGSQCDLVLGFPVDADAHELPAGLAATAPYAHTGFVLVTAAGHHARRLDQLPRGTAVAVTYQTTPNLYFADHPNLQADVHLSEDDTLKALETHAVSAAMLWQPSVVQALRQAHQADRFRYDALVEPHATFNLVALYDPQHAVAAKVFERAIQSLSQHGQLAPLVEPYAQPGRAGLRGHGRSALAHRTHDGRIDRSCGTAGKTAAPAAEASVPALFTDAQAEAGKTKFMQNCAQCHGPTLTGRSGPALKGVHFASPTAGFHVGDIFTIVSQNMPATAPGSLEHDDYVQIMAFLLQQNGYPAGSSKLTFDDALHSKVKLIYHGS